VIAAERPIEKQLTRIRCSVSGQTTDQSPLQKINLIYISWYINDYGLPWTPLDVSPRIRPAHGQIARTGRVLHVTTEQMAFLGIMRGGQPDSVRELARTSLVALPRQLTTPAWFRCTGMPSEPL
jgi:hypothetical protein